MGWSGYGIYGGDDTQTFHYTILNWAGIKDEEIEVLGKDDETNPLLTIKGTKLPKEFITRLKKNIDKVLKKMSHKKFVDEDMAIEWQMLLALFLDNKMKVPHIIKKMGILGTEYLMGEHAADFDNPSLRRRNLRNFIKRAERA